MNRPAVEAILSTALMTHCAKHDMELIEPRALINYMIEGLEAQEAEDRRTIMAEEMGTQPRLTLAADAPGDSRVYPNADGC